MHPCSKRKRCERGSNFRIKYSVHFATGVKAPKPIGAVNEFAKAVMSVPIIII